MVEREERGSQREKHLRLSPSLFQREEADSSLLRCPVSRLLLLLLFCRPSVPVPVSLCALQFPALKGRLPYSALFRCKLGAIAHHVADLAAHEARGSAPLLQGELVGERHHRTPQFFQLFLGFGLGGIRLLPRLRFCV